MFKARRMPIAYTATYYTCRPTLHTDLVVDGCQVVASDDPVSILVNHRERLNTAAAAAAINCTDPAHHCN